MTTPVFQPAAAAATKPLPDFLPLFAEPLRILLYGDSGDGKTTLIGEMAEYIYSKTKQKTRLITADKGGFRSIEPYVRLGIIEVESFITSGFADPFIWTDKHAKGFIWRGNQWVDDRGNKEVGLRAFESMSSIAEEMHKAVRDSQTGPSPIGPKAYKFDIGEGDDKIGVGTTDKGHIGIIQNRVVDNVGASQRLPGHLIWTASMRRADDVDIKAPVLGPQILGKALTPTVPGWFQYTFRVNAIPVAGQHPKHVLYLDDHVDPTAAMAKGLGNARNPLAGGDEAPVPAIIDPASLVRALGLLAQRQIAADVAIKKRLGL